jgi:hypothetical protein
MLIILNGTEATKKVAIATEITYALNNFNNYQYNGYSVDFTKGNIEIRDSAGVVVYGQDTNALLLNSEDGSKNEEGHATFKELLDFQISIGTTIGQFYFKNTFSNWAYDYGVEPEITFLDDYNSFIQSYNNRPYETIVTSGTFTKSFIDKARADLGEENVKVISVIRNPSVSYLINTIAPADGEFRLIEDSSIGIKYADEDYTDGMLCSILIKPLSYVTTVKFETLIDTGILSLDGITIILPSAVFAAHNAYITQVEKSQESKFYVDQLADINAKMSNYQESVTASGFNLSNLPVDIFADLDYTMLQLTDIVSP